MWCCAPAPIHTGTRRRQRRAVDRNVIVHSGHYPHTSGTSRLPPNLHVTDARSHPLYIPNAAATGALHAAVLGGADLHIGALGPASPPPPPAAAPSTAAEKPKMRGGSIVQEMVRITGTAGEIIKHSQKAAEDISRAYHRRLSRRFSAGHSSSGSDAGTYRRHRSPSRRSKPTKPQEARPADPPQETVDSTARAALAKMEKEKELAAVAQDAIKSHEAARAAAAKEAKAEALEEEKKEREEKFLKALSEKSGGGGGGAAQHVQRPAMGLLEYARSDPGVAWRRVVYRPEVREGEVAVPVMQPVRAAGGEGDGGGSGRGYSRPRSRYYPPRRRHSSADLSSDDSRGGGRRRRGAGNNVHIHNGPFSQGPPQPTAPSTQPHQVPVSQVLNVHARPAQNTIINDTRTQLNTLLNTSSSHVSSYIPAEAPGHATYESSSPAVASSYPCRRLREGSIEYIQRLAIWGLTSAGGRGQRERERMHQGLLDEGHRGARWRWEEDSYDGDGERRRGRRGRRERTRDW